MTRMKAPVWILLFGFLPLLCAATLLPPSIQSEMKPKLWKRMTNDKEIIVNASLKSLPEGAGKKYTFYAGMWANASASRVKDVITNYSLYQKIIPYVDRVLYSPSNRILLMQGGIWNFKLSSSIQFEEISERWMKFKIIQGHFSGLTGSIYFEPLAEKGTAVLIKGEQVASHWPPVFVIERGAEIVLDFTARRLRSYIEATHSNKGVSNGQEEEIPQPRQRL